MNPLTAIKNLVSNPIDRLTAARDEYFVTQRREENRTAEAQKAFHLQFSDFDDQHKKAQDELTAAQNELRSDRPSPSSIRRYLAAREAHRRATDLADGLELLRSVRRYFQSPESQAAIANALATFLQAIEAHAAGGKKAGITKRWPLVSAEAMAVRYVDGVVEDARIEAHNKQAKECSDASLRYALAQLANRQP